MNKTFRNLLVSALSSLLWVATIAALPFIEEMLYPSPGINNSWHRGLVLLPVIFVFAIPVTYGVSNFALLKGKLKLVPFTVFVCGVAALISLALMVPSAATTAYIGMLSIAEAVGVVVYGLAIMILSAIAPAVLWWLLGDKTHNKVMNYAPAVPDALTARRL